MPYGTIYRIKAEEREGEIIVTHICDANTFDPGATTTYTDLKAGKPPIALSVIDNDKDKFKAIRGKKLSIYFLSTPTVTARTFGDGEDNRWFVDSYIESTGERLFQGFLLMQDHQQAFLAAGTYIVQLTATDNLGVLKEVPLTKPDGTNPRNPNKIIEYVAWALQKTGLELDIIVTTSIMEENYQDLPAWDNIYLDAKTFEAEIGVCHDCYNVLQKILGYDCTLYQRNGMWWVGRVSEMTGNLTYAWRFDFEGTFIEELDPTEYEMAIGKSELLKFINKDAIVTFTRPHKFVKLTYNYDTPREIVDNIDFSRGSFFSGIVVPATYIPYHVDDWTIGRYAVNNVVGISSGVNAYIIRKFENSYEKERYLVVKYSTEANPFTYVRSNPIYIGVKDRGTISVDFRFTSSSVGDFVNTFGVLLKGIDGSVWVWMAAGIWINTATYGGGVNFYFAHSYHYDAGADKTNWQSYSTSFNDAPVEGELYILLSAGYNHGGTGNPDVHYQNLRFDFSPFINGSYQKYRGQYHSITQDGNYKANIDEVVYISDSPRRSFKGALLRPLSGSFVLAEQWYAGGDLRNHGVTPPIPSENFHPFGYIQIFAVWNQYRRRFIELTGSVLGLNLTDGNLLPDLHYSYGISASVAVPEVDEKIFVLAGLEQDFASGKWSATLIESWDTIEGNVYDDTYEFKYITDY